MYDRIDLEHARRFFKRALEVEPGEAYALAGLALVLIRLNEPGPAREYLERARELAPNSPEVVLCLGNSHFLGSEFEAAELHYRTALALRPGWNEARFNLAITYERLGRVADARGLWQGLTSTDNDHLRIEALGRLRDLEKANPVPLN